MKPSEVKDVLRESVQYVKENYSKKNFKFPPSIFIWGKPGIGKTSVSRQLSVEERIGSIINRLILADPTDGKGIPEIVEHIAYWRKPNTIPTQALMEAKQIPQFGIYFLDEFNLAKPAIQGAFHEAILDHTLGGEPLARGWIVIAAGNKKEDAYNVYDLPAPVKNRFDHINFDFDEVEFEEYCVKNEVNIDILAFHRSTKYKYIYVYDANRTEDAFPTPRTWEMVSDVQKIYSGGKVNEMINGAVGEAAGTMFVKFLRYKDRMPDINKILAGENIVPDDPDIIYLTLSTLVEAFRKESKKHVNRLIEYSTQLTAEFRIYLVRDMYRIDKSIVANAPSFTKWRKQNVDFV